MQNKTTAVRLATPADKPAILHIITTSFANDPALTWMLQRSKNKNKLAIVIDYLIDVTFDKGRIYISNDNMGASLWHSEKGETINLAFLKRNLHMLSQINLTTIIRLLKFEHVTHKQHPANKPFCYLVNIGVLPQAQGKGLGSKLMNPMLDECAAAGIPVYLETANTTNVSIYETKGFQTEKIINFDNVPFYYMKRL